MRRYSETGLRSNGVELLISSLTAVGLFLMACLIGAIFATTWMSVVHMGEWVSFSFWAEWVLVHAIAAVLGAAPPMLMMGLIGGARWWKVKALAGWLPISLIYWWFSRELIGEIPASAVGGMLVIPAFVLNAFFWGIVGRRAQSGQGH